MGGPGAYAVKMKKKEKNPAAAVFASKTQRGTQEAKFEGPGPGSYSVQTMFKPQSISSPERQFFGSTSHRFESVGVKGGKGSIGPGTYSIPGSFERVGRRTDKGGGNSLFGQAYQGGHGFNSTQSRFP